MTYEKLIRAQCFRQLVKYHKILKFGSYWQKYVLEVLGNYIAGLCLPRKGVVRLTDHPDISAGNRGCKTTTHTYS